MLVSGGLRKLVAAAVPRRLGNRPAGRVRSATIVRHVNVRPKLSLRTSTSSENQLFNGSKALTPSVRRHRFLRCLARSQGSRLLRRNGRTTSTSDSSRWTAATSTGFRRIRSDETNVQWAPRGNKVSFILHTATGSIVRTVHVPTATPLSVDFAANADRRAGWEPKAERFALVVESPDASQHSLSMTYAGEKRQEVVRAVRPSRRLVEPIGGVLVMRPAACATTRGCRSCSGSIRQPFAWSDAARGAHAQCARGHRHRTGQRPMRQLLDRDREGAWIDARKYIVNRQRSNPAIAATIISRPGDSRRRYRRAGNTLSVPPAVVQSFAAAYIADDLKGTPPPNGRR